MNSRRKEYFLLSNMYAIKYFFKKTLFLLVWRVGYSSNAQKSPCWKGHTNCTVRKNFAGIRASALKKFDQELSHAGYRDCRIQ